MHLLERQGELELLNRCFDEARAGSGKLVLLSGAAGFGKSSLIERFASEHRRNACTLWGACDALATPKALAPILEIAAQTSIWSGRAPREGESRDWLFRSLVEDLSRPERVCAVVLEDVHWADEATLDFLRYIGRRIQRTCALFVATYRDDELSMGHPVRLALGELSGHHVLRVRLLPLSESAVGVMAKDSGCDVPALHRATGGNPFFVREVLACAQDRVPETVRDAVLARLLRCAPATRELAELVSVSPARTETWIIESVLDVKQGAVDEAGACGLLDVQSDSVGFRHELAQRAVYSTLSAEAARALHEKVLGALRAKSTDLARTVHHATLANAASVVLDCAPRAAREAARHGAHREAAAHWGAALRHRAALSIAEQAAFLEQHSRECSLANLTRESIQSAAAAAVAWREAGDSAAQSRVLGYLAQEYRTVGDKARADECIASAIGLLECLPPSCGLAMAYSAKALLAVNRGWNREALEFAGRALSLGCELGDVGVQAHALCSIGSALLGSNDRSGYAPLERSLAMSIEHGLEDDAARAYRSLLFYSVLIHDIARAEPLFRDGVAHCEERGILSHSAYIQAWYTPCELDRGRWTEAAAMAEQLLRSPDIAGVQQRITLLATLGLVRVRRGDPGAEALLEEASKLALPTSELNRIGRVCAARAEHAWYRGDLEEVAREADLGLSHVGGHTAPWIKGELVFWQSRARRDCTIPEDIAEPYRHLLEGRWRESAAAWARLGMPYEQALALAEGSEVYLREALLILTGLGEGPLAAIVRRRLRECGAKGVPRGPRETTRANPAGLTTKEIEILALLALGKSNSEIGRRLHRSTKTIDNHVSAILDKLTVKTRAEAVARAYELGILRIQKIAASTRGP